MSAMTSVEVEDEKMDFVETETEIAEIELVETIAVEAELVETETTETTETIETSETARLLMPLLLGRKRLRLKRTEAGSFYHCHGRTHLPSTRNHRKKPCSNTEEHAVSFF